MRGRLDAETEYCRHGRTFTAERGKGEGGYLSVAQVCAHTLPPTVHIPDLDLTIQPR